ncbi:hypothetical protein [Microbacterium pumilum]
MTRTTTIGVVFGRAAALCATVLAIGLTVTACSGAGDGDDVSLNTPTASSGLPQGADTVTIDPAKFSTAIDNPYFPMNPGDVRTYRETDDEGKNATVVVTVTDKTKVIDGVTTREVHDVLTDGGEVVEDTLDWYAQDDQGNIWYFGEATTEYDPDGKTSTEGSWQSGVDGGQPGIVVLANPEPGSEYREEYLAGHAEDNARVLSIDELAEVPFGSFDHLLMTRNTTPLEPDVLEYKWYAKGVGPIREESVSGGSDKTVLLSYQKG